MKKNILLLTIFLIVFISSCSNQISPQSKDIINNTIKLEPTNENFISILSTNKDGFEYLNKYPNTKITSIQKIFPSEFEQLRNKTDYKELYIDLPQKQLYKVDFTSKSSSISLTTIIDLEKMKVEKIFGIMIMEMK